MPAIGSSTPVVWGAFNPKDGAYYYAQSDNGGTYLFKEAGGTAPVRVGALTPGNTQNADFAFDKSGYLYIIYNSTIVVTTQPINNPPASNSTVFGQRTISSAGVPNGPALAFDASGYLYMPVGGQLYQVNPSTGVSTNQGSITQVGGTNGTPLRAAIPPRCPC